MEKETVYLVWTNEKNKNRYKIAELFKQNGKFVFKYILENVKKAEQDGFKLLISFPNINEVYENPHLFAVFSSRLPDSSRPEIKEILETYGMTEYDEFELLKRSGAKLPTDSYEFVR